MDKPTAPDEGASTTENFYLLQRMAVGLLVLGSDELTRRLRDWQETLNEHPERVWVNKDFNEETALEKLSYFTVGSLLRMEKSGVRLALTGMQKAQQTTETAARVLHPFLDNRLTRPFQRPFIALGNRIEGEIRRSINEGRSEEQSGRALAELSFDQAVNELIDYLAQNPEIIGLIRDQSTGLATVVVDNGRGLVVAADAMVEGTLRRILRMTPRSQLPESPVAGQTQDIYSPERWEVGDDSQKIP